MKTIYARVTTKAETLSKEEITEKFIQDFCIPIVQEILDMPSCDEAYVVIDNNFNDEGHNNECFAVGLSDRMIKHKKELEDADIYLRSSFSPDSYSVKAALKEKLLTKEEAALLNVGVDQDIYRQYAGLFSYPNSFLKKNMYTFRKNGNDIELVGTRTVGQ